MTGPNLDYFPENKGHGNLETEKPIPLSGPASLTGWDEGCVVDPDGQILGRRLAQY
jgi:hypothetical protein